MKKFNQLLAAASFRKKKENKSEKGKKKKKKDFSYKKLEHDYYWQYRDEVGEAKAPKVYEGSMIVNILMEAPEIGIKPRIHPVYAVPYLTAEKLVKIVSVLSDTRDRVDYAIVEYWHEYRAERILNDNERILQLRRGHIASKNHFYFLFQKELDRFSVIVHQYRNFVHPLTARRRFKKRKHTNRDPNKIQIMDEYFCENITPIEIYAEYKKKFKGIKSLKKSASNTVSSLISRLHDSSISSKTSAIATIEELLTPTEVELSSLNAPPLMPSTVKSSSSSQASNSDFNDSSICEANPMSVSSSVAGPSGLSHSSAIPSTSKAEVKSDNLDNSSDSDIDETGDLIDFSELLSDVKEDFDYEKMFPKVAGGAAVNPIYCATVYVRKKQNTNYTVDELLRLKDPRASQKYNWVKKYLLLRERTLYFTRNHAQMLEYYYMEEVQFLALIMHNARAKPRERTLVEIGDVFKFEFYYSLNARFLYKAPYGSVIIVRNLNTNLPPVKMMFCQCPREKVNKKALVRTSEYDDDDIPDLTSRLKNLWMMSFRLAKVGAEMKAFHMNYNFEHEKYLRKKRAQNNHDKMIDENRQLWEQQGKKELETYVRIQRAKENEILKISKKAEKPSTLRLLNLTKD